MTGCHTRQDGDRGVHSAHPAPAAKLSHRAALVVVLYTPRTLAIGFSTGTYITHELLTQARERLTILGLAIGVYPMMDIVSSGG
ncbi:hypothetical protein [Actinoplanes sp. NPDC089786]|uniref:hypothetical protein n=1 Tax=Actinoplanes sp. NPDC089786 TaxID=3155185 RepID=UPI00341BAAF1